MTALAPALPARCLPAVSPPYPCSADHHVFNRAHNAARRLIAEVRYALQSFSNKWTNATTLTVWSSLVPIFTAIVGMCGIPGFKASDWDAQKRRSQFGVDVFHRRFVCSITTTRPVLAPSCPSTPVPSSTGHTHGVTRA